MRTTRAVLGVTAMLGLFFAPRALASEIGQEIADQVDVASYQHYLEDLLFTHDGDDRGFGGAQHDPARGNIVAVFRDLGLDVELQPFFYESGDETHLTYNVVATQPGAIDPDRMYILGAHYDSVDNPGADDDGSGVAGLLEIARILSQYDTVRTIKYLAFDLEERGLIGSEQYVGEHADADILGMLQLDMLAWDWATYKCVIDYYEDQASLDFANRLASAVDEYGRDLIVRYISASGGSDHQSFGEAGIPACLLIENRHLQNPCWHQACDSVDEPNFISYDYAEDMTRSAAGFIADEIGVFHPGDCDGDGVPDADQISSDPALDCNGNGWLDVCEPGGSEDCNENGAPDICDIFDGTSTDYNRDLVLDECQTVRRVPTDYPTIDAAIDAATDGDLILIADGVYTGEDNRFLRFSGKRLWLGSENGSDNCIIDCEGRSCAFWLSEGPDFRAVIDGLTIRNGDADDTGGRGGGIQSIFGALTLRNCRFIDCHASYGGAVESWYGAVRIEECEFIDNVATVAGGALYVDPRFGGVVRDCSFSGNHAGSDGGAIYIEGGETIRLEGCILNGNTADGRGGAVYSEFCGKMKITDCVISDNHGEIGGGGVYQDSGTLLSLLRTVLTGNSSEGEGGAVYTLVESTVISSCLFRANAAPTGGGISFPGVLPAVGSIVSSIFARNSATDLAGALVCSGEAEVAVTNCSFNRNQAILGGAVVSDSTGSVQIANCVFWENAASDGSELVVGSSGGSASMTVSYSDVMGGVDGVYVGVDASLTWADGNIDLDPRFTDPNNGDLMLLQGSPCVDAGDNDAVVSDLFDLDRDGDVSEPIDFDYSGDPRFGDDPNTPDSGHGRSPIVDMGAYEFPGITCPGDLDGDGDVDLSDLATLLANYRTTSGATYADGDLDGDGDVDLSDLAALLAAYRRGCP